jgi:hypothetical protein
MGKLKLTVNEDKTGGKRFFGACCCRLDLKPREIGGSSM